MSRASVNGGFSKVSRKSRREIRAITWYTTAIWGCWFFFPWYIYLWRVHHLQRKNIFLTADCRCSGRLYFSNTMEQSCSPVHKVTKCHVGCSGVLGQMWSVLLGLLVLKWVANIGGRGLSWFWVFKSVVAYLVFPRLPVWTPPDSLHNEEIDDCWLSFS